MIDRDRHLRDDVEETNEDGFAWSNIAACKARDAIRHP
jgi:hypothetical protein